MSRQVASERMGHGGVRSVSGAHASAVADSAGQTPRIALTVKQPKPQETKHPHGQVKT